MLYICRHYRWLHSYMLLVCCQHRQPAFVRVAEPRWYTPLSYIRTRCTSASITAGYIRRRCSSAINIIDLRSYALQNLVGTHHCPTFVHAARLLQLPLSTFVVCRQHRLPAFVHVAELHWYTPLSYIRTCCASAAIATGFIRTCCSSAVNIVDLRSYALQNLVGTHCCPTFVHAAHMPLTSSTCVRTYCRTSLVHTTVLHSYMLRVCCHCRCLHSSSAVNIVNLCSYALQNFIGTHRCPTFVHAAPLPLLPLATFVRAARLPSTSSTCVRTRCKTSLVPTAVLHSYAQLVCYLHRRPGLARVAEHRWYPLLSYIRACCLYAVNIVDLHSHALQSFVGTHCCSTFVRAARMPSIPLTCVCTRCRSSLVPTAVLHSYALLVCSQHH